MPRLTLAVFGALVLHGLLLLAVVPKQRVSMPQFMGSGQVTISIARLSSKRAEKQKTRLPEEPMKPPAVLHKETVPVNTVKQKVEPEPVLPEPLKPVMAAAKTVSAPPVQASLNAVVSFDDQDGKTDATDSQTQQDEDNSFPSQTELLREPQPLENFNHPPAYPALARKRGWEGTVILEVDISSDGMVQNIKVKQSSSYALLDNEALKAVGGWRFQPGSKLGVPVDMKVLVPVHFILQEQ